MTVTSLTRGQWAPEFLHQAKLSTESAPVLAVLVRIRGEYAGTSNFGALWNPLDTTLSRAGATPYNSFPIGGDVAHVWNFHTAEAGIAATVATIQEVRYTSLRRLLGEGEVGTVEAILEAWNESGWGQINWQGDLAYVQAHLAEDSALLISGSTKASSPAPATGTVPVTSPPAPATNSEEESTEMIVPDPAGGPGQWYVVGTRRAGIPREDVAAALELAGVKVVKLSADQLSAFAEVPWGQL